MRCRVSPWLGPWNPFKLIASVSHGKRKGWELFMQVSITFLNDGIRLSNRQIAKARCVYLHLCFALVFAQIDKSSIWPNCKHLQVCRISIECWSPLPARWEFVPISVTNGIRKARLSTKQQIDWGQISDLGSSWTSTGRVFGQTWRLRMLIALPSFPWSRV